MFKILRFDIVMAATVTCISINITKIIHTIEGSDN